MASELEEKERRLRENILLNYHRIKDVERELAELQARVQLRVNVGPKKHALEMLRRKIEIQTEKLGAAQETLAAEERTKEHLCQELNLLVQQSASSQLDKLEQLTQRLEHLNRGLSIADHEAAEGAAGAQNGVGASAATSTAAAVAGDKPSDELASEAQAAFAAAQQNAAALRGAIAAAAGTEDGDAGGPATAVAPQAAATAAAAQQVAGREAELRHQQQLAAEARARHVALPGRGGGRGAGAGAQQSRPGVSRIPTPPKQQQQQQLTREARDASGAFRGWE
eukprot:scaffold4.g4744.t1